MISRLLMSTNRKKKDPYWANVSVLIQGHEVNGGAVLNNKTGITAVGTGGTGTLPSISSTVKRFGNSSIYFNGSSHITLPDHVSLELSGSNFTIEMWVYPTANDAKAFLVNKGSNLNVTYGCMEFSLNNLLPSGLVNNSSVGNASQWYFFADHPVVINTWSHLAWTRLGNDWYLYINGILSATKLATATSFWDSTTGLQIGCYLVNGVPSTSFFTGYMEDIRITKGVCRYYATNFIPPRQAFSNF
jgi:hypothetical protein